jgi:Protein of unknown function (DUF3365)
MITDSGHAGRTRYRRARHLPQIGNLLRPYVVVQSKDYRFPTNMNMKLWMGFRFAPLFLLAVLSICLNSLAQSSSGSIGGTIHYSDGKPIEAMLVVAMAAPDTGSSELFYAATRTDSMGRYRLMNLPPRSYYVKAGGCPQDRSGRQCPINAPIYIYYPRATSKEAASMVSVASGSALENINFTLTSSEEESMRTEATRLLSQAQGLWALQSAYKTVATPTWSTTDEMHRYHVDKFIATPGMGSGRMAGMLMQIDPQQRLLLSDGSLTINTLELIGIAKHESAVVFTRIAHGPEEAETRKLTAFEQHALTELMSGKEIVSSENDGSTLVVGAIRARTSCLSCHNTSKVGDLLGAFRYELK